MCWVNADAGYVDILPVLWWLGVVAYDLHSYAVDYNGTGERTNVKTLLEVVMTSVLCSAVDKDGAFLNVCGSIL